MKTFLEYLQDEEPDLAGEPARFGGDPVIAGGVTIDYTMWTSAGGGESPSGTGTWRFALGQMPRGQVAHGDPRIFQHVGDFEEALVAAQKAAKSRNAKTAFLLP